MEQVVATVVADSGAILSLRLQDALAEGLEVATDLSMVTEDYLPPGH